MYTHAGVRVCMFVLVCVCGIGATVVGLYVYGVEIRVCAVLKEGCWVEGCVLRNCLDIYVYMYVCMYVRVSV